MFFKAITTPPPHKYVVDKFWKFFWILVGGSTLIAFSIALSLFMYYTRQGNLLAAVGVSYEAGKGSVENGTLAALGSTAPLRSPSGYLYQNMLPLRFQSWTWEATADWRSSEQKSEGSYALKTVFKAAGGSVGMNGPDISIVGMHSISLMLDPDASVGDLYLNVYDTKGASLAPQSLAWYASSTALVPDTWQKISIPLGNLGVGSSTKTISGFSISGENPGTAYVDAVQLSKAVVSHPLWVAPPNVWHAFNPFATSTPSQLPYTFSPNPDNLARWYSYFGSFGPGPSGEIEGGPFGGRQDHRVAEHLPRRHPMERLSCRCDDRLGAGERLLTRGALHRRRQFRLVRVLALRRRRAALSAQEGRVEFYFPDAAVAGARLRAVEERPRRHGGARGSCLVLRERRPRAQSRSSRPCVKRHRRARDMEPNSLAAPHTLTSFVVSPLSGE